MLIVVVASVVVVSVALMLVIVVVPVDFNSDLTANLMASAVPFARLSLPPPISRIANNDAADSTVTTVDFSLNLAQEFLEFVEVSLRPLTDSSRLTVGSSPTLFQSMELFFEL